MKWGKKSKEPSVTPQGNPQPSGRSNGSAVQQPKTQRYAGAQSASYHPSTATREKASYSYNGHGSYADHHSQQYGATRQASPSRPMTGYSNNRVPEPLYQRQHPQQKLHSKQHASAGLAYRPAVTASASAQQSSTTDDVPLTKPSCLKEVRRPPPMLPGDRYTPRSSIRYPAPLRQ